MMMFGKRDSKQRSLWRRRRLRHTSILKLLYKRKKKEMHASKKETFQLQ
jgi:hypothetical protein